MACVELAGLPKAHLHLREVTPQWNTVRYCVWKAQQMLVCRGLKFNGPHILFPKLV